MNEFLSSVWGKRALFLRQALPGFVSPLSPDELAGLACEAGVESRLIRDAADRTLDGAPIKSPWKLEEGPFDEEVFASLGERDWTLLVQDVDKLIPEVARLLSLVSFLPRWSVDDIMVSFAAPGASVGPHTDRYDVFLLQTHGSRQWGVSAKVDPQRLRADAGLRVLEEFEPEESYLARPGDVLYLPPGVGHYGVAEEDCMTISFGFRAPTQSALASHFADEMVQRCTEEQLREQPLAAAEQPMRLSAELLAKARQLVEKTVQEQLSDEAWLGRHLTAPKPHLAPEAAVDSPSPAELRAVFQAGGALEKDGGSRFLYSATDRGVSLYVNGDAHALDFAEAPVALAEQLCGDPPLSGALLEGRGEGETLRLCELLAELLRVGAMFPSGGEQD